MANQSKIVLLGAHRWRREPIVAWAELAGIEPYIALYESEHFPEALKRLLPHQVLWLSPGPELTPTRVARRLFRPGETWFVMGLDDYVCEFASDLSALSSKTTMPAWATAEALFKNRLRKRWNRIAASDPHLKPVPFIMRRYDSVSLTRQIAEESDQVNEMPQSLIVKPNALDASIGIHAADSPLEVLEAIAGIAEQLGAIANYVAGIGITIAPEILIEERIQRSELLHPGAEYSAEVMTTTSDGRVVHRLIGVTQKYTDPQSFVEIGHCFPSETFPLHLLPSLTRAIFVLLEELQVSWCISHWEFIVTVDERLALVEAQLRPAGDTIMDLVERATGTSPYSDFFAAHLGGSRQTSGSLVPGRTAAVFFPQPSVRIHGEFSLDMPPAIKLLLGKEVIVDNELASVRNWNSHAAWDSRYVRILTHGANYSEARRRCESILSDLRIKCTSPTGKTEYFDLTIRD